MVRLQWWVKGSSALLPVFILLVMACASKRENKSGSTEIATTSLDLTPSISVAYERGVVHHASDYTYYLPIAHQDSVQSVYLVFFDPQGKGSFPVERFKGLAEKYGVNLVGSHRSRNGNSFETGRETAQNLVSILQKDFPGKNKSLVFAGFSGGAKVALSAGMDLSEVKGVVYAGAPWKAGAVKKPVLGFAGTGDMNYADLLLFDQSVADEVPHQLVEWEGKHTWPDSATFEETFVWVALLDELKSIDYQAYYARKKARLPVEKDPFKKAGIYSLLGFMARHASTENPLKLEETAFLKSTVYQQARRSKEQIIQQELSLKEEYNKALVDKDPGWWKAKITRLQQDSSSPMKAMNQRLLGYFSLAAYTYSNRMLMAQELALAGKFLEIYRLADPANPEQAYLQAVLAAKTNQPDRIVAFLKEAIDLGFTGKQRMLEQAEFQPIRSQAGFQELVGRVKE